MNQYRIGVDIGGTFTDIVFLGHDGRIITRKVSSTVDDYARAIAEGVAQVFESAGIAGREVKEVLHGTTVASNAILEHKGARTGLITTKGFRDVLEIRTLRMPKLYDMGYEKPPSLVERHLRMEVDERVNGRGEVERALDPGEVARVVDKLVAEKVEAIAVCLLHCYANPIHERMIKAIVQDRAPGMILSISSEVLPEIKEYERTSTAVINAYVKPIVAKYLESLIGDLKKIDVKAPLLLMQSNGGLTTAEAATEMPMNIIESGPAAGVVGAQALAKRIGLSKIISFDMGGTTAKTSLIEEGEVTRAEEYSVGGGIMIGSRLMSGAGYTLKVPAIDLAEVGAGGGSVIWIDAGGVPQVGPHSAGAYPGPVCYDLGGTEPTVTDANIVLGYINPEYLAGGFVRLKADKSRAILQERIAKPLGLPLERAAYGAHLIAASNMIRAIKAVSSERGRDPREYALFAFGGNGPLFAAGMAQALGISKVIVPPSAGVFSSFGLLYSDIEYHFSLTHRRLIRSVAASSLSDAWGGLEQQARTRLTADGFLPDQIRLRRYAKLHYQGQSYELTVPVSEGPLTDAALAELEEAFGLEHERTYGHRAGPDEPAEIVSINLVARGIPEQARVPEKLQVSSEYTTARAPRHAYFGLEHGWVETPVLRRADLKVTQLGPCIVEEYDSTCVVPPGARAKLDDFGNIVIELGRRAPEDQPNGVAEARE